MDDSSKRLVECFSHFGLARFLNPNFKNGREIDFAGIELITTEKVEKRLIEEINSHLDEHVGIPASLRAIQWAELSDGKFRYVIEIVPYSFVPKSQYESATAEVLRELPKIIKNYGMKVGKR